MAITSNIKITGFDEMRPPQIQRQPCIDLIFKLDQEAPRLWSEEFNSLIGKQTYSIKIDPKGGKFIETWVRKSTEVSDVFDLLKESVQKCNRAYERRVNTVVATTDDVKVVVSPEQQELN